MNIIADAPDSAEAAVAPILLVEDTASLQLLYESMLQQAGHAVHLAGTGGEAMLAFAELKPGVVLLDLMLPDCDGLDLLREMLARDPETAIIVITANGSINKAVAAMRGGAHDFLVKPFDENRLLQAVAAAGSVSRRSLPARVTTDPAAGFIGRSPVMRDVYAMISAVAPSTATVFITGESGTGKEVCAEAIHAVSGRARGPFVPLNCGAIPGELMESEVFGHLKGSFTGAISDKPGAAAIADGGTLFLDEICELDLALQTKLLRFLQTSTIQPVGATRQRKVNVRVICATNRDPAEEVRRGRFREDLFYRLYVVPIHMPPLRERDDDAIEIAGNALMRYSAEEGRSFRGIAGDARNAVLSYPWPGNVRQLLNVMRNVVVLNDGPLVTAKMLPRAILDRPPPAAKAVTAGAAQPAPEPAPESAQDSILSGLTLAEVERVAIEQALARNGGSIPQAARDLAVAPSTLYRKIAAWSADPG